MTTAQARELLDSLFRLALDRVHGHTCVSRYLLANPLRGPVATVAIGKAAAAMTAGAAEVLQAALVSGLVVSPAGQADIDVTVGANITLLFAEHPVPGPGSIAAGQALLAFISELPADCRLLFLISGGASSLVEVPVEGIGLAELERVNRWLLGSGFDIAQTNRVRTALSRIKGGQLRAYLGAREACVLLLSDVPTNDVGIIGSGLLHPAAGPAGVLPVLPGWLSSLLPVRVEVDTPLPDVEHHIVATNHDALAAIVEAAAQRGHHAVINTEPLTGDVHAAAGRIIEYLKTAPPGLYLWGGETTVVLPDMPGDGGRNQQLALAVALQLAATALPVVLLAAGTDGRDGNSVAAGAIIDAESVQRGEQHGLHARAALASADAGTFLAASGDRLLTGPSGTNVMDIVIALKQSRDMYDN
jgi:hydroxypyruvate reductase